MAEAALVSLAGKILGYLSVLPAEKVLSWWGVDDDLKQLDSTMRIINAGLQRHASGEVDDGSKDLLQRLKKVLYHADDLFDEIFTVKHQTSHSLKQGSRLKQLRKKVLLPFSKSGPIYFNYHVAQEIKSIRKELDAIKSDLDWNNLDLGATSRGESGPSATHLGNKWETSSSVNPDIIVGRENEKNNIIKMLLSEPKPNEGSISVIPIVGMGGIGKTTLAQLAFNDDRVKNHFNVTKWVWLSEKDNNQKDVIGRIFMAFTDRDYQSRTLEKLQSSIRGSIEHKKYLLVLDNVWDDSRERWLDVIDNFLISYGKRGSKILVTTRSPLVAQNIGKFSKPYKIQLLSNEESWDLFQKVAVPGNNPNLESIGKEIVKKCGNVPLAIRAIGSVLYGKDESEWTRFKDFQLAKIDDKRATDVLSLLKLSYDPLPSELKQCFSFLAFRCNLGSLNKNDIIGYLMSLGFIKRSSEDYSLDLEEEVGLKYFSELLSRNFFIEETDENKFIRVHDLMVELAAHVSDEHKLLFVNDTGKLSDVSRYVALNFNNCESWEAPLSFPNAAQMRYLYLQNINPGERVEIHRLENMLSIFISLRVLELLYLMIESVPDAIGNLRHLRSLIIRGCPIKCLPNSIKKLWNLQILILNGCRELKALPAGISRLINLRSLELSGSDLLTDLPPDFGKLKSLRFLCYFIVSVNNGLDALANMNLSGNLRINYRIWREDAILEAKKANLKDKHLKQLELNLGSLENIPHDAVSLLQQLQPPPSLELLAIDGYQGERLPDWMGDSLGTTLPRLIKLRLESFKRSCFLSLGLCQLPCLKYLVLSKLPELRGWSRVSSEEDNDEDRSAKATFPCLEYLEICECPRLIPMPYAPRLVKLIVEGIDVHILARTVYPCLSVLKLASVHGLHSLVVNGMRLLKDLRIMECRQLTSIAVESPTSIKCLEIKKCERLREIKGIHHLSSCLETLRIQECEEMNELPPNMDCLMSLGFLSISGLRKLRALPGSIGQLINIRELSILGPDELRSLPDTFNNLTQLRAFQIGGSPKISSYIESTSFSNLLLCFPLLEVLVLGFFQELKALPESIQHLSHLRSLGISNLPEMRELPTWLTKLTSLRALYIWGCPQIEERCKEPEGPDWPLIRHIPNLSFQRPS